jgi:hypothetical protein
MAQTEPRLVDVAALLAEVTKIIADGAADPGELLGKVLIAITDAPTVDAVEVIRCENCERWKDRECGYFHSEYTTGNQVTNSTGHITRPEDYCSFARRKPDETNQKAIDVPAC